VSVYMSLRFKADRAKFEELAGRRREQLLEIAERAKGMGAIHHRFAAEDGDIVVIDEWESPEAFERFFESSDDVRELMAELGVTEEPQVTFYEPLSIGDEF
jgi:heme-degrading monooxygenase HmoA